MEYDQLFSSEQKCNSDMNRCALTLSYNMNDLYCIVGITLLLSSIMMSIMKTDKNIFINFDNLLDNKQKAKYRKIIKERTCIYISGLILGLLCGLYYLYSYKKDSKRLCKFIIIVYVVQLGFYYFLPKSPLMLYSLNTILLSFLNPLDSMKLRLSIISSLYSS